MDIGIGAVAMIPGTDPETMLAWAREADQGPFSSLAFLDRLVFTNYETTVSMAMCAAVTERIRLVTTVLLLPPRNAAVLAKEAATIDAVSGGRLTLGLGVGGREDDFAFTGADFHRRGRKFERDLTLMKQIWQRGEVDGMGPIGPRPARQGGPEILIGGYSEVAAQRTGKFGDGFIAGGGGLRVANMFFPVARESWQRHGRPGAPRLVGCFYYYLGEQRREAAFESIATYYGRESAEQ